MAVGLDQVFKRETLYREQTKVGISRLSQRSEFSGATIDNIPGLRLSLLDRAAGHLKSHNLHALTLMRIPVPTSSRALIDESVDLVLIIQGTVVFRVTVAVAMMIIPSYYVVADPHGLFVVLFDTPLRIFTSVVPIAGTGGRGQGDEEQRDWQESHSENRGIH
jgi:hypothetical protein